MFNIFHTATNCVTAGINSSSAGAQNSWENLKKSETQKLALNPKKCQKQLKIGQRVYTLRDEDICGT